MPYSYNSLTTNIACLPISGKGCTSIPGCTFCNKQNNHLSAITQAVSNKTRFVVQQNNPHCVPSDTIHQCYCPYMPTLFALGLNRYGRKSSFDFTALTVTLTLKTANPDLENSKPIFSHNTRAHDHASPHQVWLEGDWQFRRYLLSKHSLNFEPLL